mgnify:CR=1 FL=1
MKFKQYQYLKQHLFEFTAPDELKNRYEDIPTRNLSPLVLAYVGDAYYHLIYAQDCLILNNLAYIF